MNIFIIISAIIYAVGGFLSLGIFYERFKNHTVFNSDEDATFVLLAVIWPISYVTAMGSRLANCKFDEDAAAQFFIGFISCLMLLFITILVYVMFFCK